MKTFFKVFKWGFLIVFIILNIVAYNHAYKFTHFTTINGERIKPENLSFGAKLKILFTGVDNPRPLNIEVPKGDFKTVMIQGEKRLESWWIEVENSKGIVVLFHGYSGNKSGNIDYAARFNQFGYSTLLIDFRGSGGSEGNQTTIGFDEAKDVEATYDYIKDKFLESEVILFGSSMGAVAIMKAVAELKIEPTKIILECPFGTMRQTVKKRFEAMNVPSFLLADMLMIYGGLQNGFNPYQHQPIEYAKEIDIPTLLFYGEKDARVTLVETEAIYNNLNGEKKMVVLKHSAHENYLNNDDSQWKNAVQKFTFEENIISN